MKNTPVSLLLAVLPWLFAAGLSGQNTQVDLYLKPDLQSPKVGRTTVNDSRLGQATPVTDQAAAAQGWHVAKFSGPVDVYVPDGKIGKDMLPVDDALLYTEPSVNAAVAAIFKMGDPIEIVDTGAWWKMRYGGGVPVYFILTTPPPLPPVTGMAQPGLGGSPSAGGASSYGPAAGGSAGFGTGASGVDVFIAETPVVEAAPSGTAALTANLPRSPSGIIPGVTGQSHEGVLKRAVGVFANPLKPFYLEDALGQRIAWVDTKVLMIPGSIKAFIDKPVVVHGERTVDPSTKDWIIQARNMRLK